MSAESRVSELESQEQLDELFKSADGVVLFFWAGFEATSAVGGPMDAVFGRLAGMHPSGSFLRVDAEKFPRVTTQLRVQMVPSFVVVRNGAEVARVEGADPAAVARAVTTGLSAAAPARPPTLEERLRALVSKERAMLFMKGSPAAPRCGFSDRIVKLLTDNGWEFGHFDILSDSEVREGLKKFSNWPTYPQLYVDGKLIGGLDVVKEMAEEGELDALKPNA